MCRKLLHSKKVNLYLNRLLNTKKIKTCNYKKKYVKILSVQLKKNSKNLFDLLNLLSNCNLELK